MLCSRRMKSGVLRIGGWVGNIASTPDEPAWYIKSEMAKWTKVAQAQKIRVDLTR